LLIHSTDAIVGSKDFPKETHKALKDKKEKKKEAPKE
jgi:hypothetical protein